ncbi:uncharacterized protein BP01DRAFT_380954 [Aspergillus saccharolyticus JOP 1030-1]|uniref:Uncharacterized protein n=1 Tax=Aspergillus saccharolyticus JOP 1030-1 TaxID=1450539 RepID=A0A318ZHY9_9EURO|nr:hypothetical protein BP01DRAFT_380954 [Aspergillus saccharolyticus JOP 1030-1]PYH47109.1 hypothetical protein BP01DRAFT_380954 [Aspergillus saccharolyticus JOP 1030-1]
MTTLLKKMWEEMYVEQCLMILGAKPLSDEQKTRELAEEFQTTKSVLERGLRLAAAMEKTLEDLQHAAAATEKVLESVDAITASTQGLALDHKPGLNPLGNLRFATAHIEQGIHSLFTSQALLLVAAYDDPDILRALREQMQATALVFTAALEGAEMLEKGLNSNIGEPDWHEWITHSDRVQREALRDNAEPSQ